MLKILINPNPILRKKSQPVADVLAPEIQALIPQMVETMKKNDGAGLAAPQIGQSIRLAVICHKDKNLILINPKITRKSLFKEWSEEGCLSVPGKFGEVKRHKNLTVEFIDEKNDKINLKANGLLARIIQHEIDHLDGVLFIDKSPHLLREIKPSEKEF